MTLFASIIIPNLVQVPCCAAQTISVLIIVLFGLNRLSGIDFNSRDEAFRIVIGSTQYFSTRLNRGGMLSVNKRKIAT